MNTNTQGTIAGASVRVLAPAKVNLTLHVTGQREDGYHTLDSLVVFADHGDIVTLTRAEDYALTVHGPRAAGIPSDDSNLCLRAARLAGVPVTISLEKTLPAEAGIGGGSADAAAVLRGISTLTGVKTAADPGHLGADVPVCMASRAARMQGIGDRLSPISGLPPLPAILVNPGMAMATPPVFRALRSRANPPMPAEIPSAATIQDIATWLLDTRNDLEAPALEIAPGIGAALADIGSTPGCLLSRMSGSGATCFGLFPDATLATNAAQIIAGARPDWWVQAVTLS